MSILGIDYGEKRIGLACADVEVGVALPVAAATGESAEARFGQIAALIRERRIQRLVVGYPLNMDGSAGFKAKEVDAFIAELEKRFGLPVERMDERLTSHAAEAQIAAPTASRKKGKSAKKRLRERRRGDLDSRAAALILQDWLDQQAPQRSFEHEDD